MFIHSLLLFVVLTTSASAAITISGPDAFGTLRTSIASGQYHSCAISTDSTVRCWGWNPYGPPPSGTFVQVAAAGPRSCGIRTDATVVCWGQPFEGTSPSSVTAGKTFYQIAVGNESACALALDGVAVCWGKDNGGSTKPPVYPAPPPTPYYFSRISVGAVFACGIMMEGGTVRCWGKDSVQFSGSGYTTPPGGTFVEIVSGDTYSCGLTAARSIVCWGDNTYGQSSPPGGVFRSLTAGSQHACGIRDNGTVACWGYNVRGQASPPAGGRLLQVTAGWLHACGIYDDGTLGCWGSNQDYYRESTFNQANPNVGAIRFAHQAVAAGDSHTCVINRAAQLGCFGSIATAPAGLYMQVASGYDFSCAVTPGGQATCWGGGVRAPDGLFTEVAAGADTVCGLRPDGTLACSRDASKSVPGLGDPVNYGQASPPAGRFVHIGGNFMTFCATRVEGGSACWGMNRVPFSDRNEFCGQASAGNHFEHQVSGGVYESLRLIPYSGGAIPARSGCLGSLGPATPLSGAYSQIANGRYTDCALQAAGRIACWGDGRSGQLAIPAGTYSQVSTGSGHVCGVTTDNLVRCWGANNLGQSAVRTAPQASGPVTCGNVSGRFSTPLYNQHLYDESRPDAVDGSLEFVLKASLTSRSAALVFRKTGSGAIDITADVFAGISGKGGVSTALVNGAAPMGGRVLPEAFVRVETGGNSIDAPNAIRVLVFDEEGEQLYDSGVLSLPRGSIAVQDQCLPTEGVVNTASLARDGLVSPGSRVTLVGEELAGSEATASAAMPLATLLGDVRVLVNGRFSPLFSVAPGRIDFQVPYETFPGTAELRVLSKAETVYTGTLSVVPVAPGVFADVYGQASARNEDGSANSADSPAAAGSTISLFATGLGKTESQLISGYPGQSGESANRAVEVPAVLVGGVPAEVLYAGAAPGYVGLDQVTVRLPAGAFSGAAVPVQVLTGGAAGNFATIAIR